LAGNREIEDSLERLDKLTEEEERMASAEQLKMTHSVDGKVMGVDDRVRGVQGQVQDVRGDMKDVRGDVQDVGDRVQDVDDKLDQANRSSSLDLDSHSAGSDNLHRESAQR
jgi:predicted nuclease with TOPRIM domain